MTALTAAEDAEPDITTLLREWCEGDHGEYDQTCVHCNAADEIDKLRTQLGELRQYCATGETP